MTRKVLLGLDPVEHTDIIQRQNLMSCIGWLTRMGYDPDVRFLIESSSWLADFATSSQGYEFIVFLKGTFGWNSADPAAVILDGRAVIPTFCIGIIVADTNSTVRQIGIERLAAGKYKWVTHRSGFEYPTYTGEYVAADTRIDDVTPITVIQYPDSTSSKTIFNQCKVTGPATTVYVDCGSGTSGINLPSLMQEAVNDGLIAAPTKRLKGTVDIDDYPDPTTTLADLQATYAIQAQHGIPSTWGIIADNTAINNVPQDQYDFVAANSPDQGGLIYPIDHAGNDYWDSSYDITEANYLQSISNMASKGVKNGSDANNTDSWGYRYFNTNAINDSGLRVCAKYKLKAARLASGVKGTGVTDKWIGTSDTGNCGAGSSVMDHRGMVLLPGVSAIASTETSLDKYSDVSKFANNVQKNWVVMGLAHSAVLYMHGGNFYDGHDGGNAPGNLVMSAIGALGDYMTDVVEHVHPSAHYSPGELSNILTDVFATPDYLDSLALSNEQPTSIDADYDANITSGVAHWAVWDKDSVPAVVDLAAIQSAVGAADSGSATITQTGAQTTITPTVTDTETVSYRFYIAWVSGTDESLIYFRSFGYRSALGFISDIVRPTIRDVITGCIN